MKRIETNNFILTQSIVEANGDSTWIVKKKSNSRIFYIHVFNTNYLNIKFFDGVKDASEAITALCNNIVEETGRIPCINIYCTNEALIITCKRAGFRKFKNVKQLYKFKIRS